MPGLAVAMKTHVSTTSAIVAGTLSSAGAKNRRHMGRRTHIVSSCQAPSRNTATVEATSSCIRESRHPAASSQKRDGMRKYDASKLVLCQRTNQKRDTPARPPTTAASLARPRSTPLPKPNTQARMG